MICKKFESSGVPSSCRRAWTPRHDFAVPKSLAQFLTIGSVAFEEACAQRVTPPRRPARDASRANWARVASGRQPRSLLEPVVPVSVSFIALTQPTAGPEPVRWVEDHSRRSEPNGGRDSQGSRVHEISDRKIMAQCPGVPATRSNARRLQKIAESSISSAPSPSI